MTMPAIAPRLLVVILLLSAATFAEKPADPGDGELYRADGEIRAWSASAEKCCPWRNFGSHLPDSNDGRFGGDLLITPRTAISMNAMPSWLNSIRDPA